MKMIIILAISMFFLIVHGLIIYITYSLLKKKIYIPFKVGFEFQDNLKSSKNITNLLGETLTVSFINRKYENPIENIKNIIHTIEMNMSFFYSYTCNNFFTWEQLIERYDLTPIQISNITCVLQNQAEVIELENVKQNLIANIIRLLSKLLDLNKKTDLLIYGNLQIIKVNNFPINITMNNLQYILNYFLKTRDNCN